MRNKQQRLTICEQELSHSSGYSNIDLSLWRTSNCTLNILKAWLILRMSAPMFRVASWSESWMNWLMISFNLLKKTKKQGSKSCQAQTMAMHNKIRLTGINRHNVTDIQILLKNTGYSVGILNHKPLHWLNLGEKITRLQDCDPNIYWTRSISTRP